MPRTKRNIEKQKRFGKSLDILMGLSNIKDNATMGRLTGIHPSQISRYRKSEVSGQIRIFFEEILILIASRRRYSMPI